MSGSPADREVGAEEVESGYLSSVLRHVPGDVGGSGTASHPRGPLRKRLLLRPRSGLMALAFETKTVRIPNTEGAYQTNDQVVFDDDVRKADVAIKAFKLDYAERPTPATDVVQVGASLTNIGGETVEFSVKTNFSGTEYTGEVSVLVIADLLRD
jgi:hypothetical protein